MTKARGFRTAALSVAALMLAVACSTSLPHTPGEVSGRWGGSGLQVTDSTALHGIIVSDRCDHFLFAAPVVVDNEGRFSADGTIVWATYNPAVGRGVQISGTVSGRTMHISVRQRTLQGGWGPFEPYVLNQGEAGDWAGWACVV